MSAEPGSRLVEELTLLAEAVAERAGPWLDRVAATSSDGDCSWCPLCAIAGVVRGEPNELAARGMDGVADLVALLRAVLADRWEPATSHMPGFRPDEPPADTARVVRHIPLRWEPR